MAQRPSLSTLPGKVRNPARRWMFTINNPDGLLDLGGLSLSKMRYCIYSEEMGESGTNHFQGYAEFKNPVRLSWLRNNLFPGHYEVARGTRFECREYCRKMTDSTFIDGPYEWGSWDEGGQGNRADMTDLRDQIKLGKTNKELFMEFPGHLIRYWNGVQNARNLFAPVRNFKSQVTVIIGKPGVGKSTRARLLCPTGYTKQHSNWWDQYDGVSDVIIDDFRGWLPFTELLQILDQFPYMCQIKGGQVNLCPKQIVITCNTPPHNWYSKEVFERAPDLLAALTRRFDAIWWIREQFAEPVVFQEYDTFLNHWFMEERRGAIDYT